MKTFLILGAALLTIYIAYRTYRLATLGDGLESKLARGAVILDVRTAEEYRTGHIDGSVNISLGTLRQRYTELDPEQTYITTCSHGLRSVKAESLLRERGFKKVCNGGAWSDLQALTQKK